MRALLVLVVRDLRQHLRDRAVLLFALVIPFSLSFVFSLAFAGVADGGLDPVTVAVSAPADDAAAGAVVGVLQGLGEQGLPVTTRTVAASEVGRLVETGVAGVGVVVPEGFGRVVAAGTGARVQLEQGEDVGLAADVVAGVVTATMQRLDADSAAVAAAGAEGLSEEQLMALGERLAGAQAAVGWTPRTVAGEQLGLAAGIVAGQAGMFLFFTVGFAVLTVFTEREWGTLSRLQTMPVPAWSVPAAKALVAVLLGVASTTVLLASGELLLEGVELGSWPAVLALVVATVVAATSVMALVLRVARTAEQASLALSVVAISLGVAGGTFFRLPGDGALGSVLQVNPVAGLVRGLGITAGGGGLAELAPVLLTLVGFTVVVLVLARVLPARRDAL